MHITRGGIIKYRKVTHMKVCASAGAMLADALGAAAQAQEVLLFPVAPSASKAGLTMQDSVHKKCVE